MPTFHVLVNITQILNATVQRLNHVQNYIIRPSAKRCPKYLFGKPTLQPDVRKDISIDFIRCLESIKKFSRFLSFFLVYENN